MRKRSLMQVSSPAETRSEGALKISFDFASLEHDPHTSLCQLVLRIAVRFVFQGIRACQSAGVSSRSSLLAQRPLAA